MTDEPEEGAGFLLAEELLFDASMGLMERCRQKKIPVFLLAERDARGRADFCGSYGGSTAGR